MDSLRQSRDTRSIGKIALSIGKIALLSIFGYRNCILHAQARPELCDESQLAYRVDVRSHDAADERIPMLRKLICLTLRGIHLLVHSFTVHARIQDRLWLLYVTWICDEAEINLHFRRSLFYMLNSNPISPALSSSAHAQAKRTEQLNGTRGDLHLLCTSAMSPRAYCEE